MMGATYDDLRKTIKQKWHHLNGELLLHYERFVLMPPPFNTIHLLYYLFCYIFLYKKCIRNKRWKLIGKWKHEEDWIARQKRKILEERYTLSHGGLSPYSPVAWKEITLAQIDDEILFNIQKAHKEVVNDIIHQWCKMIRSKKQEEERQNLFGTFEQIETINAIRDFDDIVDSTVDEVEDHVYELETQQPKKEEKEAKKSSEKEKEKEKEGSGSDEEDRSNSEEKEKREREKQERQKKAAQEYREKVAKKKKENEGQNREKNARKEEELERW